MSRCLTISVVDILCTISYLLMQSEMGGERPTRDVKHENLLDDVSDCSLTSHLTTILIVNPTAKEFYILALDRNSYVWDSAS